MRIKAIPPPVGNTTFARWLDERRLTPFIFWKETGIAFRSIRRLAGVGNSGPRYFTTPLLQQISAVTGIPINVLIEDAEAALAAPTPPRKYQRKAAAAE